MDINTRLWIRVLLLDDTNCCTLKINSDFIIDCPETGLQKRFKQIEEPMPIQLAEGTFSLAGQDFKCSKIIITPDEPNIFNLNGSDYRGKLLVIAEPNSGLFDAINLLPPQAYLAGVIAAEMPDYWEPDALKAQEIEALGATPRCPASRAILHKPGLGWMEAQAVPA